MNLAQKQTYCRALGIDIWLARRPLAGAPRGHCVMPLTAGQTLYPASPPAADHVSFAGERASAVPAVSTAQTANGAHAPAARAPGRQLLDEFADAKPTSRRGAGSLPVRTGPSTAAATATNRSGRADGSLRAAGNLRADGAEPASGLRFSLICVVHQQLLLLDEITDLKFTPSAYNGWLKSIFYALGTSAADISVGQQDQLAWPPASTPVNPASPLAARSAAADMLHAWLQRKLVPKQGANMPPNILLMGRAPRELLLAKGSPAVVGDMAELPLLGGKRALLLPGSNELWAAPQLKRECWRHLQESGIAGHVG